MFACYLMVVIKHHYFCTWLQSIYISFSLPSWSKQFSRFLYCPLSVIRTAWERYKLSPVAAALSSGEAKMCNLKIPSLEQLGRFLLWSSWGSGIVLPLKCLTIHILKHVGLLWWFDEKWTQFFEDRWRVFWSLSSVLTTSCPHHKCFVATNDRIFSASCMFVHYTPSVLLVFYSPSTLKAVWWLTINSSKSSPWAELIWLWNITLIVASVQLSSF